MKCQFCGKETEKVFSGPRDIVLCEQCYNSYKKNQKKETEELQEVKKVTPVPPSNPPENPVICEMVIGMKEDQSLYFNIYGEKPNLILIDGLIKYAERRIRQHWDIRDQNAAAERRENKK